MLRCEFRIAAPEQVWGTPTYVTFVCGNADTDVVSFTIGNGREDSFRFHSEPSARDLDPYYEFGGLAPIISLQPSQTKEKEVLLNQYLQFLHPGRYLVRCELDLEVLVGSTHARRREQFRSDVTFNLLDDAKLRHKQLAVLETDLLHTGPLQVPAAIALSELRSPEVLPILERGLRSANTAVVERMLIGFGNTGGDLAKRILREFIESPASQLLIRIAKQELAKLDGQ